MRRTCPIAMLVLGGSLVFGATPAAALFHLWDISEVYSNADGTVQFIELSTTSALQEFITDARLASRATLNIFVFPGPFR